MDDTLLQYDESLEALEKQRENLELVMQKMGEEWEESGAGIGWMGDILYSNTTATSKVDPKALINEHNDSQKNHEQRTATLSYSTLPPPLINLMQSVTSSTTAEPSRDYLQTLLNVNEELLAQSLASTTGSEATTHNTQESYQQNNHSLPQFQLIQQQIHFANNNNNFPQEQQKQKQLPISPAISQYDNETTVNNCVNELINNTNQDLINKEKQRLDINELFTPPITPEQKSENDRKLTK